MVHFVVEMQSCSIEFMTMQSWSILLMCFVAEICFLFDWLSVFAMLRYVFLLQRCCLVVEFDSRLMCVDVCSCVGVSSDNQSDNPKSHTSLALLGKKMFGFDDDDCFIVPQTTPKPAGNAASKAGGKQIDGKDKEIAAAAPVKIERAGGFDLGDDPGGS